MSGESEESNLKPQESENAVLENNVDEKGKKLKRNYCYVCEVQCTAVKNFLEHQKGKRHLKKLSQLEEPKKKSRPRKTQIKDIQNSSTRSLRSNNSLETSEQKSEGSELHEVTDSHSCADNSTDNAMSNLNRHPKFKNNYYLNSNYHNNHSKYQNSRYSYNDGGQDYFYNQRPYPCYSRWSSSHYPNTPPIHNNCFINYADSVQGSHYYSAPSYNTSYEKEYFPVDGNAEFNSQGCIGSHKPFTSGEPENSVHNFLKNQTPEMQPLESNSVSSRIANKSSSKNKSDPANVSEEAATLEQSASSTSDLNQSSASTVETDMNINSMTVSKTSNSSNRKVSERKRLRTRSLSSTESLSNDKRLKDKNESPSVDSDGTSEEQKLKEYTTSLLETNPNRISRMIQHPSNYKEKAVLNHIVTSFSKTKRKENLTKKLRSNSLGSAENDDVTLEVQSVMSENDEISIIYNSEATSTETIPDSDQNKCTPTVKKAKNSSKKSNLNPVLNNEDSDNVRSSVVKVSEYQSSKKSSKVNGKNKESSVSTSKVKAPERRKKKNSECAYSEKSVKRKNLNCNSNNKGKKQRFEDVRNLETPHMSSLVEQSNLNKDITVAENAFNNLSSNQINPASLSEVAAVKEEVAYCTDVNQGALFSTPNTAQSQILDFSSPISVETLIELFASGNVTAVKKEFNDPAIEAIKGVDPNELISACSNDSHLNNVAEAPCTTLDSNTRGSKSSISESNCGARETTNCINPVILGSTVDNDNITPVSIAPRNNSLVRNLPSTEKSKDSPSSILDTTEQVSLSEMEKLNLISRTKSEFPHLSKMIVKLQEIASEEDNVKMKLSEAKFKINEYSSLLDEWKNKKKRLHNEEELLRKKRNDIIKSMENAVKTPSNISKEELKNEFLPGVHSTPGKGRTEKISDNDMSSSLTTSKGRTEKISDRDLSSCSTSGKGRTEKIADNNLSSSSMSGKGRTEKIADRDLSSTSTSSSSPEVVCPKRKKTHFSDSDEILILPPPVKPKPQEIVIFDDEENTAETQGSNGSSSTARENVSNVSNQGSSFYNEKNLTVHSTVINCIVVFEDFVYTCSNDNTAKRFSLQDTSQVITYLHTTKNVTEIAVEKVQNEALVFTSCSNRVLSMFIASNGTKIKSFFQPAAIMSICKGWGKFYAGLNDGTVNVYNWKYEEKEIVKTQNPTSRIATTHQGRLRILIILTSDGHIALRDAETSLLIRCIKAFVKLPSFLIVYNDFAYITNSDRSLLFLDLLSGRIEKKIYINSHATGLAVYDDHIFTITYSGIINCINKDKISDKKIFFGAGKNGLTCIHVAQDWVFTGNRKGDVSVFQFNPNSKLPCKFSSCSFIYGAKEDLEFHVEKDHLLKKKNLTRCYWETCTYIFPSSYNMKDKVNHTKKHINSVTSDSGL